MHTLLPLLIMTPTAGPVPYQCCFFEILGVEIHGPLRKPELRNLASFFSGAHQTHMNMMRSEALQLTSREMY